MDVVFVDSGDPWNPRPETVKKAMAMLQGVHRVLKPDGVFISISFGQPHFRRPLFEAPEFSWSIEWKTFGDGFHYFFYILKKGRRMSDSKPCMEKSDRPSISLYQEELEDEDYMFRTNVRGVVNPNSHMLHYHHPKLIGTQFETDIGLDKLYTRRIMGFLDFCQRSTLTSPFSLPN
ncbi:hypothetical protein MKX01_039000 [Papaver californicum]|nr:hypothetical protein MKX01_039000 [Papaver californicum]